MVDVGSLQKHVLTGLEGVLGYWLVTIVMIFGDYMVECPTSLYDDDHHHHHHLPLRSEALVAILVMYSRWHLGVHTFEQLVVGGSVGGVFGIRILFYLLRSFSRTFYSFLYFLKVIFVVNAPSIGT